MSRMTMVTGLIHSSCRAIKGRGRYHAMLSKSTSPPAQMVSYVYSVASTNSSTLTSSTHTSLGITLSRTTALSTRYVSADPAPAIGLTMMG